ncbi:MAG: hypothetical protein QGG84_00820, partial [Rhodospirillales bacterium]|nr:hypothetical protein [Rhodospirillales bacterium]
RRCNSDTINPTEIASITKHDLSVEINAKCDKTTTIFQLTNLGEKWPRLGTINIYRIEDKALLSKC